MTTPLPALVPRQAEQTARMHMPAKSAICPCCGRRAGLHDEPLSPVVEVLCGSCGWYTAWDLFNFPAQREQ